jgi:hypothetical protein
MIFIVFIFYGAKKKIQFNKLSLNENPFPSVFIFSLFVAKDMGEFVASVSRTTFREIQLLASEAKHLIKSIET